MSERQMVTTLDEVRLDHRLRYEFAVTELKRRGRLGTVIDAGAGVGYGSNILSRVAQEVHSIELSPEAKEIFQSHWSRDNIHFHCQDLLSFSVPRPVDAVVSFEFIEHVPFYDEAIARFAQWSDLLIISTPNEAVRPHKQEPVNPFHFRHFTPDELSEVLHRHGFEVGTWHCQRSGAEPELLPGTDGKFMIAVAERAASGQAAQPGELHVA